MDEKSKKWKTGKKSLEFGKQNKTREWVGVQKLTFTLSGDSGPWHGMGLTSKSCQMISLVYCRFFKLSCWPFSFRLCDRIQRTSLGRVSKKKKIDPLGGTWHTSIFSLGNDLLTEVTVCCSSEDTWWATKRPTRLCLDTWLIF